MKWFDAFDVPEKTMPEAGAVGRTLDQARDVGDDERAEVTHVHDTQIGFERGKWIIGDLRLAAEMTEISVDLPAFGNRPARHRRSASTSSWSSHSPPGRPI